MSAFNKELCQHRLIVAMKQEAAKLVTVMDTLDIVIGFLEQTMFFSKPIVNINLRSCHYF